MDSYIFIEDAKYVEEYKIYLKFNDGKENTVNFKEFLENSNHPDIKKYQDKSKFQDFTLEHGEIAWNDYELAFPIYDLYKGKI